MGESVLGGTYDLAGYRVRRIGFGAMQLPGPGVLGRRRTTTVAVDAPIIVTNATGARACERLVSRHFARYNASCYPANTSNPICEWDPGTAHSDRA